MRSATRKISAAGGGFTLVELLVVIAVIAILVAVTLPSMSELFRTGSDSQAHNLIAAQLAAARALAIQEHTTAGVHVQLADDNRRPEFLNACFAGIVMLDASDPNFFILAPGYQPQRMPGMMAFGQIDNTYVTAGGLFDANVNTDGFMSFTVLFSSNGGLESRPLVNFSSVSPSVFFDPGGAKPKTYLWDASIANNGVGGEPSVNGMVMFDYEKFLKLAPADRPAYLDSYGEVLPINHYTGALMGRERQ